MQKGSILLTRKIGFSAKKVRFFQKSLTLFMISWSRSNPLQNKKSDRPFPKEKKRDR